MSEKEERNYSNDNYYILVHSKYIYYIQIAYIFTKQDIYICKDIYIKMYRNIYEILYI